MTTRIITPSYAIHEVVKEVRTNLLGKDRWAATLRVFDPGCGTGALGGTVLNLMPGARIGGLDLVLPNASWMREAYKDGVRTQDFFTARRRHSYYDLIICNPPFTVWTEFVDRIFQEWADRGTIVAVLGRLGILASRRRRKWWSQTVTRYGSPSIRVLSRRPSFRPDGKTDATEYGWYVWNLSSDAPPLGWYKGE